MSITEAQRDVINEIFDYPTMTDHSRQYAGIREAGRQLALALREHTPTTTTQDRAVQEDMVRRVLVIVSVANAAIMAEK